MLAVPPSPSGGAEATQTPSAGQGPDEAQAAETLIHRQVAAGSAAQLGRSRCAVQGSTGTGAGFRTGVGQVQEGHWVPAGQSGQTQGTPASTAELTAGAAARLTVCVVTVDGSPELSAAGMPGPPQEQVQDPQPSPGAQVGHAQAHAPASVHSASSVPMPVRGDAAAPHEHAQGRHVSPAAHGGQAQVQVPPADARVSPGVGLSAQAHSVRGQGPAVGQVMGLAQAHVEVPAARAWQKPPPSQS